MSDYLRGMEDALIYVKKRACKSCRKRIDEMLEKLGAQRAEWVGSNIFDEKKIPA